MRIVFFLAVLTSVVFADDRFSQAWPDTNFGQSQIDFSEVKSGGPPKDGIPALDTIKLESLPAAIAWQGAKAPAIWLQHRGVSRAYPLSILIWHEIINDELDGLPIAVTFCPLCNASIVFDRRINGQTLSFGVSGLLRFSDMIMYDRQTESWWQQFTGEGIVGDYEGVVLNQIPAKILSLGQIQAAAPLTQVVSRDTGHRRAYGNNPYRGYDAIDNTPFLYPQADDSRLAPMTRVVQLSIDEKNYLIPERLISGSSNKLFEVAGQQLLAVAFKESNSPLDQSRIQTSRSITTFGIYRPSKTIAADVISVDLVQGMAELESGEAVELSLITGASHFAFAWLAFDPLAEIVTTLD